MLNCSLTFLSNYFHICEKENIKNQWFATSSSPMNLLDYIFLPDFDVQYISCSQQDFMETNETMLWQVVIPHALSILM